MEPLLIDCISDTHNQHARIQLPGGDILIHSGDCSGRGTTAEIIRFLEWFQDQDYSHLILIPGNHDWAFEKDSVFMADECKRRGITLLNDSGVTIEGIKIWGSPVQPWFYDWAFNRHRGAEIKKHWDLIPSDTEILVTHGPPHMILDAVPEHGGSYRYVGCEELYLKILQTSVKLHVFGHIHEGAGVKYDDGRTYVNASSLDGRYVFRGKGYIRVIKENNDYLDLP